jgi:Flp pilus assembly protein TadG
MIEAEISPGKTHRGRCASFISDKRGATAVEFALVAGPFLALLFAIFQTFLVFFAQELLESVVQQSARQILTGQVQQQLMDQTAFNKTVCNQVVILFNCTGLMVDVQVASAWSSANTSAPALTFNGQGQVSNTWQFTPGVAGDIVVVRVMYLWPVFMKPLGLSLSLANLQSNGSLLLMATAAFQNEPSS